MISERMGNMVKHRIISLISVIMLILSLAGCGKETAQGGSGSMPTEGGTETVEPEDDDDNPAEAKEIQPETITFIRGSGDPQTYVAYVITPGKIDYYEVPRDGITWFDAEPWMYEYTWEQYTLEADEWKSIVDILNAKGFSALPEDLSTRDIMDGSFSFIEVLTENERFLSGGSNIDAGERKNQKKYAAIEALIRDVLKDACVKDRLTDEYWEKTRKKLYLYDTIPLMAYFESSGLFEGELESVMDTYVIYNMGEEFDPTDQEIIKGVLDIRMSADDLTEFYNEVMGYDRTFTPQSEWQEGERVYCSEDGYVYVLWDYDLIKLYNAVSGMYSVPGSDGQEMESTIFYYDPEKDHSEMIMDCMFTLEYSDNSFGYKLTSFEMTPHDN